MTGIDTFNVVVGVLGIISFVFSIWVWMKSDMKIRELSGIIESIHDITGTVIWESQITLAEDYGIRLQHAERTLGFVTSIRKLTSRYIAQKATRTHDGNLGQLIERGIVWTKPMVMNVETSKETTEIWLVTADFKPDSSDKAVGKLINNNINDGKRYVYFYPDDLPHFETEQARLFKNILLEGPRFVKYKEKVKLVPLNRSKHSQLFTGGNIIFFYLDEHRSLPPRCFEEIVLTQVSERGSVWQEHSETKANDLRHLLASELHQFSQQNTQ